MFYHSHPKRNSKFTIAAVNYLRRCLDAMSWGEFAEYYAPGCVLLTVRCDNAAEAGAVMKLVSDYMHRKQLTEE